MAMSTGRVIPNPAASGWASSIVNIPAGEHVQFKSYPDVETILHFKKSI